jgi:hypothetical protein
MNLEIAAQKIKLSFEKNDSASHSFLNSVAASYGNPGEKSHDFEIVIAYDSNLHDGIKKIPEGIVHIHSNPANTSALLSSNKFFSRISWSEKTMKVSVDNHFHDPDMLVLENIKLLIGFLCIQKGGLPCHASVLYKDNTAIAFIGGSGSGKSTIAALLSDTWKVIDDDFNIFLPSNGIFRVHTTPFYLLSRTGAKRDCALPIPLERIFVLKKGVITKMSRIESPRNYWDIMENTFAFSYNDYFGEKILENCQRLCETVPVSNLFFAKTVDLSLKINDFLQKGDML